MSDPQVTITLISRGISRKGSNVSETALQFKHLTENKDKLVYQSSKAVKQQQITATGLNIKGARKQINTNNLPLDLRYPPNT